MVYKQDKTYKVISRLINHGWIPLDGAATLLGYSTSTTLYHKAKVLAKAKAKAKTKEEKDIHSIKVGGVHRVYEEEMIRILGVTSSNQERQLQSQIVLSLYRRLKGNG